MGHNRVEKLGPEAKVHARNLGGAWCVVVGVVWSE